MDNTGTTARHQAAQAGRGLRPHARLRAHTWKMMGPRTQTSPRGCGRSECRYFISGMSSSLTSQHGTGLPTWPVLMSPGRVMHIVHALSVIPARRLSCRERHIG